MNYMDMVEDRRASGPLKDSINGCIAPRITILGSYGQSTLSTNDDAKVVPPGSAQGLAVPGGYQLLSLAKLLSMFVGRTGSSLLKNHKY